MELSSALLSLPAELRLQIYGHLFENTTIHTTAPRYTVTWRNSIVASPIITTTNGKAYTLPGILFANRQLRYESLPVFSAHLTIRLSPLLAHCCLNAAWAAVPPRLAGCDLVHFRELVRHVDLGTVTYCGKSSRAGAEVEDLDLSAFTELRTLRFEVVTGEVVRLQFRCAALEENEHCDKGTAFAQVLEEQWCESEKRCFGLGSRIEDVKVTAAARGGADAWEGQRNRFVGLLASLAKESAHADLWEQKPIIRLRAA